VGKASKVPADKKYLTNDADISLLTNVVFVDNVITILQSTGELHIKDSEDDNVERGRTVLVEMS